MSYVFYKDIITEIALKLNHSSVVHLLGRDYADEEVMKYVESCNPMVIDVNKEVKDSKSKNKNISANHKKATIGTLKEFGFIK